MWKNNTNRQLVVAVRRARRMMTTTTTALLRPRLPRAHVVAAGRGRLLEDGLFRVHGGGGRVPTITSLSSWTSSSSPLLVVEGNSWWNPPRTLPTFSRSPRASLPSPRFLASSSGSGGSADQNDDKNADQGRTLPRGFQDFFPKRAKAPPPGKTAAGDHASSSFHQSSDNDHDHNRQGNQRRQGDKPPPNNGDEEDAGNVPGLLALLALILALRSALDESRPGGGQGNHQHQEITWHEFSTALLPYTARLTVVNKRVAQITLRADAPEAAVAQRLRRPGGGGTETLPATHGGPHGRDDEGDDRSTFETTTTGAAAAQPQPLPNNNNPKMNYYFYIGSVEALEEKLTRAQQDWHPADWIEVHYVQQTAWGMELLKSLPLLAFIAAVYFGTRGVGGLPGGMGRGGGGSGGGNNIFSIGKSPAKKISKQDVQVSFKDVAGAQQAKQEIMEFVDFLKDATRFEKLGAKIPKGALLCGPPGTGKTLLAKAVAGEAGVPFYSVSGSDFIEMFVGVGPSRVRDLFKEARANAPCIVFVDEIDAVGRQRGRGGFSGGGNDERENTLNQLLVEMDGFSSSTGVVVLAGTNRVDILDSALTRPGRFDRQITVDRPDLQGRKEIFQVHLQGITLEAASVDDIAGRLAGLTPGFAGADIANLCNEAAIVAARRKAESVSLEDFEKATDRIIGGLESHKIMSPHEKSVVAHHEAGHAVAGWFLEHADPLLKVTIIPRTSGALGFAQYLPKEVFLRSREQIMDVVCMALAGRAAEQVFFDEVTTGASDDLRRVTQLVYSTIRDFGMNTRLGQLSFPSNDNAGPGDKPYSESTAEAMDEEARSIVAEAYQRTVDLITEHKQDVAAVASLLLERETITHDDMVDLVGARPFAGDPAYAEYITQKHKPPPQTKEERNASSKQEEEEGNKTAPPMEDGGLTPGLA